MGQLSKWRPTLPRQPDSRKRSSGPWACPGRPRRSPFIEQTLRLRIRGVPSFCPACLAETDERWSLNWRSACAVLFSVHGVRLATRCPDCGSRPFNAVAWIRSRDPGWTRLGRRGQCRTDLRTVTSAAVREADAIAGQEDLIALQAFKHYIPGSTLYLHGTELSIKRGLTLYMKFIDHERDPVKFERYDTSSMLPKLPFAHRWVSRSLARLGVPRKPLHTAHPRWDEARNESSAQQMGQLAAVTPIHITEWIPAGFWPEAVSSLNVRQTTLARIGLATALARLSTGESWPRTASRLGLQYRDHLRIPAWWRRVLRPPQRRGYSTRFTGVPGRPWPAPSTCQVRPAASRRCSPLILPARDRGGCLRLPGSHTSLSRDIITTWAEYTGGDTGYLPASYRS